MVHSGPIRVSGADVRVEVLGPARLVVDGRVVPIDGKELRRLLTRLVLGPRRGEELEVLFSQIWADGQRPRTPGTRCRDLSAAFAHSGWGTMSFHAPFRTAWIWTTTTSTRGGSSPSPPRSTPPTRRPARHRGAASRLRTLAR